MAKSKKDKKKAAKKKSIKPATPKKAAAQPAKPAKKAVKKSLPATRKTAKPVKKADHKKAKKASPAPKVKKAAKRSLPDTRAAAANPMAINNCVCREGDDGLFYCMVRTPSGSLKKCPGQPPFMTMEECMESSC